MRFGKYKKELQWKDMSASINTIIELRMFQQDYIQQQINIIQINLYLREMEIYLNAVSNLFQEKMFNKKDL